MANLTVYKSFNFLAPQDWFWVVTQNNSSSLTITDGIHTQTFSGAFAYDSQNVYGQVYSTSYYDRGQLVYSVSEMSAGANDATQLQGHAETYGDTQATHAYVLSGNDSILGSAFDDTLLGYSGNDSINGGTGADTMLGGSGNDTYYVDNISDRVYETTTISSTLNAGGTDKVISSVSFSLAAYKGVSFVEHLTLSGTATINGTGNTLANKLIGTSAANVLNGSNRAEILYDGPGNETYYVDKAGDC